MAQLALGLKQSKDVREQTKLQLEMQKLGEMSQYRKDSLDSLNASRKADDDRADAALARQVKADEEKAADRRADNARLAVKTYGELLKQLEEVGSISPMDIQLFNAAVPPDVGQIEEYLLPEVDRGTFKRNLPAGKAVYPLIISGQDPTKARLDAIKQQAPEYWKYLNAK